MNEIASTADVVYSASLSCEVCNQLMEPLVLTLPIRRPNCLSHSSLTVSYHLSFFLSSFPSVLRVTTLAAHSRMLNKTVGLYSDANKRTSRWLLGLLMKLFSNLNPEGLPDIATILRSRAPFELQAFPTIAARELTVIVPNLSSPSFCSPLKLIYASKQLIFSAHPIAIFSF